MSSGKSSSEKKKHQFDISDHYNGNVFFNPISHYNKSFSDLIKWQMNRTSSPWPIIKQNDHSPKLVTDIEGKIVSLTFVNHSTFLIQLKSNGKIFNLLTDPVFSFRASPFPFLGPKRVRPPGLSLDKLPKINFVLISHNHYDHLDATSLEYLNNKHEPDFITPIGNSRYLSFADHKKIHERDWYEKISFPDFGLTIHIDRAHHWSKRTLNDTNKALWGSFVIETDFLKIYFAGDTGYQNHFSNTKDRHGKINLALLPIGAYEPRWFMKDSHMNPEDAVQAHLDLNADHSVGMHFGTFKLTDEGIEDPIKALEHAKVKYNVLNFETLQVGQTKLFNFDK